VRFDLSPYFSPSKTLWIAKHNTGQLGGLNYLESRMDTKICTKCGIEKSLEEFGYSKLGRYKRRSACNLCLAEYAKIKNSTPEGKAYILAYSRTPKRKASIKAYDQLPSSKAKDKEYRNSLEAKRKRALWLKTPKGRESYIRTNMIRRSRMLGLVCDLTYTQWEEIKLSQNYRCAICGEEKPLTRDHIIPLSRGGAYTKSNIQGLCGSCNSIKHNRTMEEYLNEST
jgi:5-methylcytosine-specific restriction endonuclease McrA